MNTLNILVLSDSLGAPRNGNCHQVLQRQTWPYLLRDRYQLSVDQITFGHATLIDLYKQLEYWEFHSYDTIIIQAGLNDILPRALHKHEQSFLSRYKLLGKITYKVFQFIGITNIRKYRKITYSTLKEIHQVLLDLSQSVTPVIYIPPFYIKNNNTLRFPGININLMRLRSMIKDNYYKLALLELPTNMPEIFCEDGFHLNASGHKYLSDILYTFVAR